MNITWGSIDKKHQGKGYMSAVMKQGAKIAKKYGARKITAEVVGNSPDMLSITDKQGYVRLGKIKTREAAEMWGGLTIVEKQLR